MENVFPCPPALEVQAVDPTLASYLAFALPHLPDMLTVNDPDGSYRLVSFQSKHLLGRCPSDLIGRNPCDWMHPEDVTKVQRHYQLELLGGASVQGRFRMRHEQGHYIWLDVVSIPLLQDRDRPREVSAVISLYRDASPWVQAERTAQDRLNHLALMQDLARLVWFTYDVKSGRVQHNDAFVEFTGLAGNVHRPFDWKRVVHAADRPVLLKAFTDLWRRSEPSSRTLELRLMPPGQRVRWVRISLSLMNGSTPGSGQIYGVVLDIDELIRGRMQTQRWIRQRERAGERQRQDISHELHDEVGQILTGLRWQLEATQRRINAGHWPASPQDLPLQQWMQSLDDAHTTLRAIVHRLRPPLAALGLRAAIQKLAEEFANLWLGSTRLELEVDDVLPDGEEWRVNTILGIVRESLNNVARHAKAARVRIKATASPEGMLHLSVQDDGVGMNVRKALTGETLGLTSLQERARLIDACLSIDSVQGSGTRVTLDIRMNRTHDDEHP